MGILANVQHTDAHELAEFEKLTIPEQLREIWLNGRETNGHVADAMRDIGEMKPRPVKVERWQIGMAAIIAFLIAVGPAVFWLLEQWKGAP